MYDVKSDILQKKYGKLTAISYLGKKGSHYLIECICDCGQTITTTANNLKRSHTQSCGCLQRERASKANTKHGLCKRVPEYDAWQAMKGRCYNKADKRYMDWGGRGITVCSRWMDEINGFNFFLEDMGRRPSSKHSLDRYPDTNGNYTPENCRWATAPQQNRNTRRNVWISYGEERMVLQDWANKFGVTNSTLKEHMESKSFSDIVAFYKKRGESPRKLLTNEQVLEIRRRAMRKESQKKLAAEFGVSHSLLNAIVKNRQYKNVK